MNVFYVNFKVDYGLKQMDLAAPANNVSNKFITF